MLFTNSSVLPGTGKKLQCVEKSRTLDPFDCEVQLVQNSIPVWMVGLHRKCISTTSTAGYLKKFYNYEFQASVELNLLK